jgi:hypothetical protein
MPRCSRKVLGLAGGGRYLASPLRGLVSPSAEAAEAAEAAEPACLVPAGFWTAVSRKAAAWIDFAGVVWANKPGASTWHDTAASAKHHPLSAVKHAITVASRLNKEWAAGAGLGPNPGRP